jgi:hypothetical protein
MVFLSKSRRAGHPPVRPVLLSKNSPRNAWWATRSQPGQAKCKRKPRRSGFLARLHTDVALGHSPGTPAAWLDACSSAGEGFCGIDMTGMLGGAAGGVAGSCVPALNSFLGGLRRSLVRTAERAGRYVNLQAAVGDCCVLAVSGSQASDIDAWYSGHESLVANIILVIAFGVTAGVATRTMLGLVASLLTALWPPSLFRTFAALLTPTGMKRESMPTDLIGGRDDPGPLQAVAAFMPADVRRRWRDDFNEASYDYEEGRHVPSVRDFLLQPRLSSSGPGWPCARRRLLSSRPTVTSLAPVSARSNAHQIA